MTKSPSRPVWPALLLVGVFVLLGCGSASTIVSGGPTATATVTATATASPRPPTATPTPGHLLVTVHPIECGSGTCTPYVCHTGTTCIEHGICTASAWPTFTLSNNGGLPVTWHAAMDGHAAPTTGWTLSATSGTLAGGAATAAITVNDNPSTIQTTQPDVVFTAPGQTVRVTLECGIG